VIVVLYFALTAPNVVARWAGVPGLSVYATLLIAWVVVGWWWLRRGNAPSRVLFVWGLLFAVVMLFTLLPHQVQFPSSVDGGYPLLEPQIAAWQIIPLYLMLALSPVLMLIFVAYTEGVLAERPSLNALAGAFGLAGLYLLIMILAQVFTTVYDYIPVVGPFFRDKFWLVLLVPSLGAALPAILARQKQEDHTFFSPRFQRSWVGAAVGLSVVALVGAYALAAKPTPPPRAKDTLRVFTYNIQQGYDAFGERNFDGQVQLLRSRAPDIIGLQECDTARIAGGNADIVAYFADWLRMYSYYGPSPVVGTFGDALLSRYPNKAARTYYLYSEGEQVAVVQADVLLGDQTYRVYVNHFGNGGPMVQAQQLLDLVRGQTNAIIIGDFNFRPYEEQYALITAEFDDAYEIAVQKNIPADFDPQERIDHVFVSPGIEVLYVEYLTEPESDHPGLFVEVAR
jgi:endonuclease/exonuclease/phosphatase family metal-dependent hydrolase